MSWTSLLFPNGIPADVCPPRTQLQYYYYTFTSGWELIRRHSTAIPCAISSLYNKLVGDVLTSLLPTTTLVSTTQLCRTTLVLTTLVPSQVILVPNLCSGCQRPGPEGVGGRSFLETQRFRPHPFTRLHRRQPLVVPVQGGCSENLGKIQAVRAVFVHPAQLCSAWPCPCGGEEALIAVKTAQHELRSPNEVRAQVMPTLSETKDSPSSLFAWD